jgi:chemotaxis methyl-accepting protein methylase
VSSPGEFLAERIGLRLDGVTAARLERVVREGARRAGCPEGRYGRLLAEDPRIAQELINGVTVQESDFFRHADQFAFLADHLRVATGSGVIWSAGCGNGQEPWSLAMLLEELAVPAWTVLATDVSTAALATASGGEYEERQLRKLDPARRRRFFPEGSATPRLRARVRFLHHNLVAASPPAEAGHCQIVLCRNVLIYLHPDATEAVLQGLRDRMAGGALLLVGAGEAVGTLEGFTAGPGAGIFVREALVAAPVLQEEAEIASLAVMLAEGARLVAGGELQRAAECYRRAGFLEPGDPRPRERLAAVLDRMEREP